MEQQIIQWHIDRNLIDGATDKDQVLKLIQEVGELSDSVCKGKPVIDDIGDCIVILINIAKRNNLSLTECMAHAYRDIKDRKGRMVDGIFVKDGDEKVTPTPLSQIKPWITWLGGEQPVNDDWYVEVKFRGGDYDEDAASEYYWFHDRDETDIVSYRVLRHER